MFNPDATIRAFFASIPKPNSAKGKKIFDFILIQSSVLNDACDNL